MSDELKPCPFCGSTSILDREGEQRTDGTAGEPAVVICIDCNGRMLGYGLEATIAAWNHRAAAAPGGEPVAWRWRYNYPDQEWHVQIGYMEPGTPLEGQVGVEVEPLYASQPVSRSVEPVEIDGD